MKLHKNPISIVLDLGSIIYLMNKLGKLIDAINFSAQKHRGQTRKGANAEPYINHPIDVMNILSKDGGIEEYDILISAVLHDTIEDTETTEVEIDKRFGSRVARIVLEVSDDKSLSKVERKNAQIAEAPHLSNQAKVVKLADKISNIKDIGASPPNDWTVARCEEYLLWSEKVVDGIRGTNESLESRFDELVENVRTTLETRAQSVEPKGS